MVIDYITGVMVAVLEKKLSSDIGFKGIFRKVLIFMLVASATLLIVTLLKKVVPSGTAVIFFYLSNEGLSILENAALVGLPIPEKLKGILLELKEDGKSG